MVRETIKETPRPGLRDHSRTLEFGIGIAIRNQFWLADPETEADSDAERLRSFAVRSMCKIDTVGGVC
jgi:hypothetical protein